MLRNQQIWLATNAQGKPVCLLPQMSNRHGLIAGATGTGKTVTLKVMAEGFSDMGVPVFLGDIKGDLSGMCRLGEASEKVKSRMAEVGKTIGETAFVPQKYPTVFWDVYGEQGHPVRTSVKEMGPLLLSRMLSLNDIQSGVMNILFRIANDENLPMVTINDIREALVHAAENADCYTVKYGNISKATVGAIQRALAVLEDQGGDVFFGSPILDLNSAWIRNQDGKGVINILACDRLFLNPLMYSTFLLWMLTRLYETLPERGDLDKPVMVFFFDEAHLLFDNCNRQLMEKIEQIVRLIRSKGVGVFFITQNATDVPQTVLGQLSNRVQHALRAYTPLDQKAVKAAAQTFRASPLFDTESAITQLKTGEALISFLDEKGAPAVVTRATVLPPQSYMSVISPEERAQNMAESAFVSGYYVDAEPAPEADESETETSALTEDTLAASEANQPIQPAQPVQPVPMAQTMPQYAQLAQQYPQNIQNAAPAYPTPTGAKASTAYIYQQMPAYWSQPVAPVYQPQSAPQPSSLIPVFETNPVTGILEAAYKDPTTGKVYFSMTGAQPAVRPQLIQPTSASQSPENGEADDLAQKVRDKAEDAVDWFKKNILGK